MFEEPSYGGFAESAFADDPCVGEFPEDQEGAPARVFPFHVQDEGLDLGRDGFDDPFVLPDLGEQALKAAVPVEVIPVLDRRGGENPLLSVRADPYLGGLGLQSGLELTVLEVSMHEIAKHREPEKGLFLPLVVIHS